jgi:hypothetical protein
MATSSAISAAPRRRKPALSPGAPSESRSPQWAQSDEILTTATGVPIDDTDNSLRVGDRGPTLLDDFHLREKIMHFDHQRIPERVVHARGAGAHGTFRLSRSIDNLTCASILSDTGTDTPSRSLPGAKDGMSSRPAALPSMLPAWSLRHPPTEPSPSPSLKRSACTATGIARRRKGPSRPGPEKPLVPPIGGTSGAPSSWPGWVRR